MSVATPARILVVEDDPDLRRWLCLELRHEGYDVAEAADGSTALRMVQDGDVDLILLDVMLPGMSGIECCRRLRAHTQAPILLVTARDAVTDRVAGLDAGADDYVGKPFAIEELLARIRAHLRRSARPPQAEVLRCGALVVDVGARTAAVDGEPVAPLTKTEFDLLVDLVRNAGVVRSRDQLLRDVWGYDFAGESKIVDVYIRYLRAKIDQRFGRSFIHTVRGVGYVLRGG